MPFYTFHDIDESSEAISQLQSTVRGVCDASALEAARNRSLVPEDAVIAYADLGDGTVQYYYNEEAKQILAHTGKAVASATAVESLPPDAVMLIHALHYRPGPSAT